MPWGVSGAWHVRDLARGGENERPDWLLEIAHDRGCLVRENGRSRTATGCFLESRRDVVSTFE